MPHPDAPDTRLTYFLTLRLAEGCGDLLTRHIAQLRRAMRDVKTRHPFRIDAIAVLPDTLHTLWCLPSGDSNTAGRVAMLKSRFSRGMPMPEGRTLAQINRGEKGIWQRHHWTHQITDADDLERHRDMIYLSPVHAGLCPRPRDWMHTSLHRDLRQRDGDPARTTQIPMPVQRERARPPIPDSRQPHRAAQH